MNQIEIILSNFRKHFNSDKNITRRRLKKILKPHISTSNPEALLLFSMLLHSTAKKRTYSLNAVKSAANSGFPPAISVLAEDYYNKGDYAKCYPLYHQAADLEEAHALYVLADAYKFGLDGLPKNLKLAQEYEERAKKAKKWDFIMGYNDEFIMYQ